ncbi:MAG: GntR family transcriptional regulator [Bacteroidaceae bacterium]|nr:GntR family transcriptional regulator [Bacteroidaceae bacterium]
MEKYKIGHYNQLEILELGEHGAYLDGGEEKILMPKKFIPENARPGDTVSVFVYLDQDNRLVATTEQALAEVGQFAYLKVAWVNQYGAFLSWGLTKDLFVPFKEQNKKMEKDRSYLVYIYIDDMTKRIVASAKLDKFVEVSCDKYNTGDSVKVVVWKQTELGYKVIVDNTYAGLLYKNEIFQQLHIGEQLDAVIKSVRPDGRLDVALQRDGKFHVDESSEKILAALRKAGGFLPYGDKTSPEEIYRQFGISKKTFKKSVGALYKKQLLSIEEKGIKLL